MICDQGPIRRNKPHLIRALNVEHDVYSISQRNHGPQRISDSESDYHVRV